MELTYDQFLETKKKSHIPSGFKVDLSSIEFLFPFQKFVVERALLNGKYGIFSGTGTGKSRMQVTWAHEVKKYTNSNVLILCPLAVAGQTIKEAEKIGINIKKYPLNDHIPCDPNVYIINYDQIDNIDWSLFSGIALDEGSIIKNEEGVYRNKIIESCKNIPYKSIWTATPAPNDPMEIGNYSEFMDVMPRSEMLAMYFIHDGGETSKWRLKGHSIKIFWRFVSSWSIMFQSPKDIGFDNSGYDLPPLNIIKREIITEKRENGRLYNDVAISATNFNHELRITTIHRLSDVVEIVNNSNEKFVIWIKQNPEGDELKKLIPDAIEVRGNDSIEWKEDKLLGFANGEFRVLITKGKIAGMGLNYQICHNHIFASPDFSFEIVYQAVRRSWRFGQEYPVNAYIIVTDTMQNIIEIFKQKQKQFDEMQHEMINAMNDEFKKSEIKSRELIVMKGNNFDIRLGDCVQLIKDVPNESIGFSVFSPPFSTLYVYSDQLEDMGNSKDYDEFMIAFKFLVKELYRVLWSGRNIAVHCMDLPIQKGKDGYIGLRDFSNLIRCAFEDEGFIYHSRVTIWKDPVVEMQRTKALGLLHKQVKKDAAMSRVGLPDYILVFRKPGEHKNPVKCDIPVDLWQKYASPVWYDIEYNKTLNGREGRSEKDERHIAPLQLDTIERCIHLWSNKGDTVLTPFMGIGSECYQALKMGRKAKGFELKESYFNVAVKNCYSAEEQNKQGLLFE